MTDKTSAHREEYHFANCVIRSDTRELLRDGVAQKIERRSFDLVLYLLKLEGRVASKDELLEHVWGNHFVSESVIAQSIMKVRKAMGITGKEPGPIKTIHRVGYRFASEVRKAIHAPGETAAHRAPSRVLWLPTECALPGADLSWVRYGLMSVALHVLQGQGLSTVSASEAIRLFDAIEPPNPVWDDLSAARKESGLPTVHTRLTSVGPLFRLEWRMQIGDTQSGNQCEGPAPAELALRAAQQVALQIRMRARPQNTPGQHNAPGERVARLLELALALDQVDGLLPIMLGCAEQPDCPWPVRAESLLAMAQRQDAKTEAFAQQVLQSAREAQEPVHEGWAHVCLAQFHLLRRRLDAAVEHALSGVSLVHRAIPHASHAPALLLASQVLAQAGKADEAFVFFREADSIAGPVRSTALVCRFKLAQCEFHHLGMAPPGTRDAHAEALEASRLLGFTPMAAWTRIFCGLQACARGGIDTARAHFDQAVQAADHSGAPLVRLHARLQWGTLLARCNDLTGLEACVAGLAQGDERQSPLGMAVWRWLRARQLYLQGDAKAALVLAEQAMAELADLGLWWLEDNWLFVVQVALVANSRGTAQALVQRLQARQGQAELPLRRCTALAAQGMLDYALGHADKALAHFEQTRRLCRDTVMANILLLGHTWLSLIDGRNPSLGHLAPAGQWVDCTLEGRYLRSMLINKPYWAMAQQREVARVGTATELLQHEVNDAQGIRGGPYATHLPMPV